MPVRTRTLAGLSMAVVFVACQIAPGNVNAIGPVADSTLVESSTGGLALGGADYFFIGRTLQSTGLALRRGLVRFDVADNIPAGSVITAVTLRVNCSRVRVATNYSMSLRRVLREWSEGQTGIDADGGTGQFAVAGDVTWLHTNFNTALWATPGCGGNGTDRVSTASGAINIGNLGMYTWSTNNTMVADVQGWLNNPATNFGWHISGGETTSGSAKRIDARSHPTIANRPLLTITYTPPNTTPVVTIIGPTSERNYSTIENSIAMSGAASDDVGVTQVSWSNDRGGSGNATGTSNWSIASVPLQMGLNVITITARDALGNMGARTLTVNNADLVPPQVTLASPTSNATFATNTSPINMSGFATDNVEVTEVQWSNDRGQSGPAIGTTNWQIDPIELMEGDTVFTISARDPTGNVGIRQLTVTYDTIPPLVDILMPTTAPTYYTSTSSIAMSGTASDPTGLFGVFWENNRGGSGTASGTTDWSVSSIALMPGANIITVTVYDNAFNVTTRTLTVTRDNTLPTVAITMPTSDPSYSTTVSPLPMGGMAADAVGLREVTWSNNRGGNGVATDTTNWTIAGVPLQSGVNVITVVAFDLAGNSASDILTVTYSIPPDITPIVDAATACGAPYTSPAPGVTGPQPITWELVSSPPGMTINSGNGVVSWPDPIAAPTPYEITVRAANANGSDTDTWNLTVRPGDFDGDGLLLAADAAALVEHLLEVTSTRPCAADVNLDGLIDGDDIAAFVGD